MTKPTLLIISMGELGTSLLESVARSDLFETIVVASRDQAKAQQRANNAIIGAGIEGFFPSIVAEVLDVNNPKFANTLRDINPDYIFTAPSLMPWWKLSKDKVQLPFAGYAALHLSPMTRLRDGIEAAGVRSFWIGASYPDVVNPVLNRTGFGPDCGVGNVQELISKIQHGVAKSLACRAQDVCVHLVAQHAFEYFVLGEQSLTEGPPYLMKATVGDRDVTEIATKILHAPFPFPYDLHFNRVTASAGLVALQALTGIGKSPVHLPGIGTLVGGFPAVASHDGVEFSLPAEWSMDNAISVNNASLKWDGIETVEEDGTIVYSQETRDAVTRLMGVSFETLSPSTSHAQAQSLLAAL